MSSTERQTRATDSQSDTIETLTGKQARCQRDLHCYNQEGGLSLWDKTTFLYTVNIVLLFKVEYFYFSPCQGLFCTRTLMKFATGVFFLFSQTWSMFVFQAFSLSYSIRMKSNPFLTHNTVAEHFYHRNKCTILYLWLLPIRVVSKSFTGNKIT